MSDVIAPIAFVAGFALYLLAIGAEVPTIIVGTVVAVVCVYQIRKGIDNNGR